MWRLSQLHASDCVGDATRNRCRRFEPSHDLIIILLCSLIDPNCEWKLLMHPRQSMQIDGFDRLKRKSFDATRGRKQFVAHRRGVRKIAAWSMQRAGRSHSRYYRSKQLKIRFVSSEMQMRSLPSEAMSWCWCSTSCAAILWKHSRNFNFEPAWLNATLHRQYLREALWFSVFCAN